MYTPVAARRKICQPRAILLAIYLNDHLAGATGAQDLARRAAASNRASEYGPFLGLLAREIAEDRQSLLALMDALGVRVDRLKVLLGWGAEKMGRLKLNGRLLGYSPLSRLVELEALQIGVQAKLGLWRALDELELARLKDSGLALPELIARAERQLEGLERHRLRAAAEALR
jgi:hypothetical protein